MVKPGKPKASGSHPVIQDPGSVFLNAFWDLAANESEARQKAACVIVGHLSGSSDGTSLSKDGEYALKRLIKGLSSSRQSARQGFATCLSEMLQTVKGVDISTAFEMLTASTKITGAIRGAEERDLLFGRLFGYIAVTRSGTLGVSAEHDHKTMALEGLMDLHQRKDWIREVVVEAILDLLECYSPSEFVSKAAHVVLQARCPGFARGQPAGARGRVNSWFNLETAEPER